MQSQVTWTDQAGPGAFPRIPVGYSYTQPPLYPTNEYVCPHCQSLWSSEPLLLSHIRAVHQQTSGHQQPYHAGDDAGNAFLLEDAEDEDEDLPVMESDVVTNAVLGTEEEDVTSSALDREDSIVDPEPEPEGPSPLLTRALAIGFPCSQCTGVTFLTKRELDVHTSVVHAPPAVDLIDDPTAPPEPLDLLPSSPPLPPQLPPQPQQPQPHVANVPGLPSGFRCTPPGAEPTSTSQAQAMPRDELACQWCPPQKQTQPLPSKEAFYLHLQETHLRCPAGLLNSPCSTERFSSRDLLSKHIQSIHLLCPHCTHQPFRTHAALHKHIQASHARCSHCSKGSYASLKALGDHIRAAHTSRGLRTRPSTASKNAPIPSDPKAANEVQVGALHYILDTDGLEYLALITQVLEDGMVHIQWIGFDCECKVPAKTVRSGPLELGIGAFVMVNLGRNDEDFEQGEIVSADSVMRQYSVRLLSNGATYGIGVEHLLDIITLRPRQPCSVTDEQGAVQRAEIVAVDVPGRRCTVRMLLTPSGGIATGKKKEVSFDDIQQVVDPRKSFYCAVAPPGETPYEGQLLDVMWTQGQCQVNRSDTLQEETISLACIVEAWRGDHVLDDKTLVAPSTEMSADGIVFPSASESPTSRDTNDGIYKPAMRFPAALPDEKPKAKKDKKKKEDKEQPLLVEPPVKAPIVIEATSTTTAGSIPPTVPYPSAPPTTSGIMTNTPSPYPPNSGAHPAPVYNPNAAAYAAMGYPEPYAAGFYGVPGYPGGYAAAYPPSAPYQPPYPPVPPSAPPTGYGFTTQATRGRAGHGRGEGRRQGFGDAQRFPQARGSKGQRNSWGEDQSQRQPDNQGWNTTGPHPHRMTSGLPYHEAVYRMALVEQQRTPTVLPPRSPPVPFTPHLGNVGDWALKYAKSVAPTWEDVSQRSSVRATVEKVLRMHMNNHNLQLYCYGSTASGLLMKTSEMDLCLIWDDTYNCTMAPGRVKELLRQVSAAMKAGGVLGNISVQSDERLPFVRCVGPPVNFEISMSMFCGVRNSALIKQYILSNPMVRPLALVIVAWAKRSGIYSRRDGLHSYTLVLMLLYFLIRVGNVRCIGIEHPLAFGVDPCQPLAFQEPMDTSQLGNQLIGFFHFYSMVFDYSKHVVSIRTSYVVTRESKNWLDAPLAVEDPYETYVNITQPITLAKWTPIKQTINYSYRLLVDGKVNEFLFPPSGTGYSAPAGNFRSPPGFHKQYPYDGSSMAQANVSGAYSGGYGPSAGTHGYGGADAYAAYSMPSTNAAYPYPSSYTSEAAVAPGAQPYPSAYGYGGVDYGTGSAMAYQPTVAAYPALGYSQSAGMYAGYSATPAYITPETNNIRGALQPGKT